MRRTFWIGIYVGLLAAVGAAPASGTPQKQEGRAAPTLPAAGIVMHPEYAKTIGRMAYVWGWPMVNMLNRNDRITKAPHPGLLGGILPAAPRGQVGMLHDYILPAETFVTCPNQDVVYGLGFFSLDEEPVIAQVPDFGDRFWVYALYDHGTNQFGELGKPYKSKPGFYLLVGPNWKGTKPEGVQAVIRSPTALANAIPRIFMDDSDADRQAIQKKINQVVFYPLKDFDGKMKTIDWKTTADIPNPNADSCRGRDPLGHSRAVLRPVPSSAGHGAAIARRRSPVCAVSIRDGRRSPGPGHQGRSGSGCQGNRRAGHHAVLPVET